MDHALHAPAGFRVPTKHISAACGYLAFGVVAGIQGVSPFAALVASAVSLVATLPTFVVVHQWCRLSASPGAVAAAVVDAWQRAGWLALALAPVLLFFSAADIAPVVAWVLAIGLATVALLRAGMSLAALEPRGFAMDLLIPGWFFLTAGIGLYTYARVL